MTKKSLAIAGVCGAALVLGTAYLNKDRLSSANDKTDETTQVVANNVASAVQETLDKPATSTISQPKKNVLYLNSNATEEARQEIAQKVNTQITTQYDYQSDFLESGLTLAKLENIFFDGIAGDLNALDSIVNFQAACRFEDRPSVEKSCAIFSEIKAAYEEQAGEEFNAFKLIEKAAFDGDLQAQFAYWQALKLTAGDENDHTVSPARYPQEWERQRNQGIGWLARLAQLGVLEASSILSYEYANGYLVEKNIPYAVAYAQRGIDLGANNQLNQALINQLLANWEGDQDEIDRIYSRLFN